MTPEDKRTLRAVETSLARNKGRDRLRLDCCEASNPDRRMSEVMVQLRQPAEVWEPFLRRLAGPVIWDLRSRLEAAAGKCESPIEEMLFLALVLAGQQQTDSLTIEDMISGADPQPFASFGIVTVTPQFIVGRYHVDFRVAYHGINLDLAEDGSTIVERDDAKWLYWHRGEVLVESDGHEFHERTKEQASADKKKDRDLQGAGFRIFRYTGSDVWRDCMAAAEEVVAMAKKLADEAPPLAKQEDKWRP